MLMAPCGPRLTHVPTGSGCHCITHAHTHMHAHLHFSCFYPRLHNSFFYDSPPLIKPHMLSICFGVSASLSIILWPLLILLRVCLASLFFPLCLCLSSLSRSHTLDTHNKHTTTLLTSGRLIMSCINNHNSAHAHHTHANRHRADPSVAQTACSQIFMRIAKKLQSKYVWWMPGFESGVCSHLQGCHNFDFPHPVKSFEFVFFCLFHCLCF